ncbi:hypothetical protein PR048_000950 [Dryococelus australis]|uniref:DDE-1 domain-containing protein n=1 Tax=Dryococelus australis TaxID=614101 RepID=A0ABQ9IHA4_9NEOP|nr:hypothetical protein PR048_000950 [Dryococelus australis]
MTPKGLQICKDSEITLVTLPPHTRNRFQSLDRIIFKPFKAYYNVAADDFIHANPGTPINISITFLAYDFLAANVTYRPDPKLIQEHIQCGFGHSSVAKNTELVIGSTNSSNIAVTPEQLRPFPKAGLRKGRGG